MSIKIKPQIRPPGLRPKHLGGKMKTKINQFVILSLLLVGIAVASTSSVAAQRRGRNWDGYPNWGGSYQLRETALNAGYNEGWKEGRNDHNRKRYPCASEVCVHTTATKD